MVTSGYQFMNLKFVYLSKNMPTEHQHLVMVLAYRKDCRRQFKYQLSCPGQAKERISVFTELFVTILKRVVKWAKNNLLQHVPTFIFILKWEKKTSSHFEIISFINIYNKTPPKGWNDDENETLHWIMRWGWMRWKGNLAFNNDDGKKLYTENYLH